MIIKIICSDFFMIRCVSCGEEYDNDEIIYTCEKCGSVLELVSDFDVSKDNL